MRTGREGKRENLWGGKNLPERGRVAAE